MELEKVLEGGFPGPRFGWMGEDMALVKAPEEGWGVMQLRFKCGGNKRWKSRSLGLIFL